MSPWLVSVLLHASALGAAPDLTTPDWQWSSNVSSSHAGYETVGLGDVDGDGYDDFASTVSYGAPTVGVFHGTADGPESFPRIEIDAGTPLSYYDNINVAGGDFNGDGYGDLAIGDGYGGPGPYFPGSVRIYFGSATGIWPYLEWSYSPTQIDAGFGWSVVGTDVNNDGYDDLVAGAPWYDDGQNNEGAFFLFLGSSVGPGSNPNMIEGGEVEGGVFGWSAEAIGDVNGDGYGDIVVGSPSISNGSNGEGRASVYHGRAQGLRAAPSKVWEPDQALVLLGYFADHWADGGDFNGDGYDDMIVGVQYWNGGAAYEGRVVGFNGSAGGLVALPSWSVEGNQAGANYGQQVAAVGDVDDDGYDDAVVGSIPYSQEFAGGGRMDLYRGGPAGLSLYPDATAFGESVGEALGVGLARIGDVNGDGVEDIAGCSDYYTDGEYAEGRILVWFGTSSFEEESVDPMGGPSELGASLDGEGGGGCNVAPGAASFAWLIPALAMIRRRKR